MGRPRNPPTIPEVLVWFTKMPEAERKALIGGLTERDEFILEIEQIRSEPDPPEDPPFDEAGDPQPPD